jgi:uncharacterized protein
MSRENVEILYRLNEAWNRGDVAAFLSLFDRDCEVIFPPEVPEPGPFHGRAELRGWVEGFLAAWDSHHAEIVETMEVGDSVLVMLHLVGRGVGSGIELDQTDAHLFTLRHGKITRWRNFSQRSEALEAAGLSN